MSDIEKVKKLREATGAGFKDCNLAIKESGGDLDKAVEILRVKGISKASKKMSRDAKEGVVAVSGDQNKTSIIEVNCETDFVAKNDDFINFVKELSEINNQNNSDVEKLKKSKMKNNITVEENLVALIAKIGEKITIGKTKTVLKEGSINSKYLHTVVKDNLAKLAVAVSLETKETSEAVKNFGKQLSMHIAASNPLALDQNLIDISVRSLQVTLSALVISSLFALPLAAVLAVKRFKFRRFIIALLNALMGLPPVVVGLIVYILLSRSGPFGVLDLLYTTAAMVIAQIVIIQSSHPKSLRCVLLPS